MPVINISRQFGSCGDQIACEVADELGYELFDKKSINRYVENGKDEYQKIFSSIGRKDTGVYDYFFNSSRIYNCLIKSLIFDIASKGNAVINGRCGQFVLKDMDNVLNVRITAPFKVRCRTISEEHQIDERLAEKLIENTENEKRGFIRYLFNAEVDDHRFYDMIFNTSKISKSAVKDNIIKQIRHMDEKAIKNSDKMKALSIARLVEASIIKVSSEPSFFNVDSFKTGEIIIKGFVKSKEEKDMIQDIASKICGVKDLKNDLIIMQRFDYV